MDIGNTLWQIITILVAVSSIYAAFSSRRRQPPIEEELAKLYVTKPELQKQLDVINRQYESERASRARIYEKIEELRREIANTMSKQHDESLAFRHEVSRSLLAIERSMGKFDAHMQEHKPS